MKLLLSLFCATALTGFTQVLSASPDSAKQWQVYDGYQAEGYGRHIVLISGDLLNNVCASAEKSKAPLETRPDGSVAA